MKNKITTCIVLTFLTVGGVLGFAPYAGAAGSAYGNCQELTIPVSASEGATADLSIGATYCTPITWQPGSKTADLLVAGATYNRAYWDWPQNPETYSYVAKTLQAGRATLAFDRLGTGQSSRLPRGGAAQTVTVDAFVLHQLAGWLQDKGYRVNAVAHSLGSIVLTKEAATYKDINKVVVTGILHIPAIGKDAPNFSTSLYPAPLDPAFSDKGYDATYLTTLPNRRGPTFYDPQSADPSVIAYDEAHKDVATTGELITSMAELQTPAALNSTQQVTAPVLLVMGQTDNIFCNLTVSCASNDSIAHNEQPFYTNAASFTAATIPHTAHNLTLHPSAGTSFAVINNWLQN